MSCEQYAYPPIRWLLMVWVFFLTPIVSGNESGVALDEAAINDSKTLEDLLKTVRALGDEQRRLDTARLQHFIQREEDQQRLLVEAEAELRRLQDENDRLRREKQTSLSAFEAMKAQVDEDLEHVERLQTLLQENASVLQDELSQSFLVTQIPTSDQGGAPFHQGDIESHAVASKLRALWVGWQELLFASGRIHRYDGEIVNQQGLVEPASLLSLGALNAYHLVDGEPARPLLFLPETRQLLSLSKHPQSAWFNGSLEENERGVKYRELNVDPTFGRLFELNRQRLTLKEKLQRGGVVGTLIVLLGVLGVFVGVVRSIILLLTRYRIEQQLAMDLKAPFVSSSPQASLIASPLNALWNVYQDYKAQSTDVLQSKLEVAIIKEASRLEFGLSLVKLLAAVAPLLGLLGTVVGMIKTFQSIALFGSGDMHLLSAGISEALVTTLMGLIAAVPLLMLYCLMQTQSRRTIHILEEQGAAHIAEHMEVEHAVV